MEAKLGWALAVAGVALGYAAYGWPGVALAFTVIVFWMLLLMSRAMRVMRIASQSPVGAVPSAVMLHARLQAGLPLMKILLLTRSLGRKLSDAPETWVWHDAAGDQVRVVMKDGRCAEWALERAAPASDADTAAARPTGGVAPSA